VPGITHRYPDRCLMVTTHVCTMYCRFCTRKRTTMVRDGWDAISRDDERMIEYVRDHPQIRDVIVSGGDPLTLPPNKLKYFLHSLRDIPHVDVIRIGTRVPTTCRKSCTIRRCSHSRERREGVDPDALQPPARSDAGGGSRLQGSPEARHALEQPHGADEGINDDLEIMRKLMRALLRVKIRPY